MTATDHAIERWYQRFRGFGPFDEAVARSESVSFARLGNWLTVRRRYGLRGVRLSMSKDYRVDPVSSALFVVDTKTQTVVTVLRWATADKSPKGKSRDSRHLGPEE